MALATFHSGHCGTALCRQSQDTIDKTPEYFFTAEPCVRQESLWNNRLHMHAFSTVLTPSAQLLHALMLSCIILIITLSSTTVLFSVWSKHVCSGGWRRKLQWRRTNGSTSPPHLSLDVNARKLLISKVIKEPALSLRIYVMLCLCNTLLCISVTGQAHRKEGSSPWTTIHCRLLCPNTTSCLCTASCRDRRWCSAADSICLDRHTTPLRFCVDGWNYLPIVWINDDWY